MKRNTIILAVLLVIVLISCQKEIDWSTGTANSGQLLVKVQSKTGTTDSNTTTYTYDAQNRLIREKIVGIGNGMDIGNDFFINRNAAGVITTTVQKNAAMIAAGIDSVVTRFYYNTANARYTATAFDLTISGFTVTDSAIFSYDASGRITQDEHYLASSLLPPFLALRNQYTYTSGGANVSVITQLAATMPGDPLAILATQTFSYDTKSNPILIRNESIILAGRAGFYNTNNATKSVLDSPADPTVNFTLDHVYKYNNANKPDSSYTTRTPGGAVTASKYFYQ